MSTLSITSITSFACPTFSTNATTVGGIENAMLAGGGCGVVKGQLANGTFFTEPRQWASQTFAAFHIHLTSVLAGLVTFLSTIKSMIRW
jgi:hypothetical protein